MTSYGVGKLAAAAALWAALAATSACATDGQLQARSAGFVGCPPAAIEIRGNDFSFGQGSTWTAECDGRVYYCSSVGIQTSCAPVGGGDRGAPAASAR